MEHDQNSDMLWTLELSKFKIFKVHCVEEGTELENVSEELGNNHWGDSE